MPPAARLVAVSAAAAADADDAPSPRARRHRALADARRDHILAAARETFFALGLEGASLREIARRAGYTPGAIYSYFPSKEEIYATLLAESLERLNAHVAAALPAIPDAPADALHAGALAFFGFYRDNPRDLDLGFYLFQGMRPRGLTPEWNERLNARLHDALLPQERALAALGLSAVEALTEVTALFAHIAGLLLLDHTGRIRMFGRDADLLCRRYLDDLIGRATR